VANRIEVFRNGAWVSVTQASARNHRVGVDPHKSEGGKRRGKSMKVDPREDLSGNLLRENLLRVREIDPNAELTTVANGRRVKMIRYIDPSRKTQ
jgi:hypothetical protein